MDFIKNLLTFFKPNNFEGDNYGWLTNQMAHYLGSFIVSLIILGVVLIFNSDPKFYGIPLGLTIFWVAWETYHYIIARNIKDSIEDLFYELSGAYYFWLVVNLVDSSKLVWLIVGALPFTAAIIAGYIKRSKQ